MTDSGSYPALRELRLHLVHPLTLTALGAVSAVLSLIGPFGTISSLPLLPRAAYWTFLTMAGYAVGCLAADALLRPSAAPARHVLRIAAAGAVTGAAMTALVSLLNVMVFGLPLLHDGLPALAATTLLISIIVMAAVDLFRRRLAPEAPAQGPARPRPPILDRLPLEKRGPLVALSVEDHYVRVRTTKGEEMILLRLADAIREVGPSRGAQVHRSHWAAFDQVVSVARDGDRAILTMTAGGDIPVSRRHIPTIREAGLLPR